MTTLPKLQALVLADHVYVDRDTGKIVVAGIFAALLAEKFPAQFSRTTHAYLSLTDFVGDLEVVLRFVDLKDNKILMQSNGVRASSTDRLATHQVIVELPPFPMPHEGVYMFEASVNDDSIGNLRVQVSRVGRQGGGD